CARWRAGYSGYSFGAFDYW
nr:immunoglobulin heavy chain junction region [Macaca mulatta]MOW45682.1 immunoglobulin heavy chain junction region [Macaca mulatta]MOW45684.1 immunoglobulin heavy chain junction region [Macaca mulatta]MOW45915.1 immunoglobulin heavy chain junction region [Macaca mulatta]MOW45936.1 immunoglobulin heavy chain junction region [Macaca mulatta]